MLLIFGFMFMIFIFVAVGVLSQILMFIIDMPSLLIIIIPLLFFLIASKSGKIIRRYIIFSFKKTHTYTRTELTVLSISIKNIIRFTLAIGGFGSLTGLIGCLAHLGSLERFGSNLAVSLITLTYSIIISFFVFFPLQAWADNKINSTKE